MRKIQHQTLPSEYYYNERCKMTEKEQKLIIYLTRWNRTEAMKLIKARNNKELGKKEFYKRMLETNEVLTSALEMICAKYGVIAESEGEGLYLDLLGDKAEHFMDSLKELMDWDRYVIDTENDDVDKIA